MTDYFAVYIILCIHLCVYVHTRVGLPELAICYIWASATTPSSWHREATYLKKLVSVKDT